MKEKKKYIALIVLVVLFAVFFAFFLLATMKKPRGYIIHVPPISNVSFASKNHFVETPIKQFLSLSPASFAKIFGVSCYKPPPQKHKKVKKKLVKKIKKKVKVIPKPKILDLSSLGYRLTGLITGKDSTVVFIYDPEVRKNRIIRKGASDTIQILHTWLRKVELNTPKGKGILHLQHSKIPSVSSNNTSNSASAAKKNVVNFTPPDKKDSQPPQSPYQMPNVRNLMSQGKLNLSYNHRDHAIGLAIKSIPSSLNSFQLRKGDVIIGNERQKFHSLIDANKTFQFIQQRHTILRIKRGNRILFLPSHQKH